MRESRGDVEHPPHDFQLKDLREWHLVECICWMGKRSGLIEHRVLMRGRRPEMRLMDLERDLRCTQCDRPGIVADHTILVRMAPRN
jgi:hypothetical protein